MQKIQEIWTEKYRPEKLSDVIGQKDIVERLQTFVKNKSLPHCLFAGPAGCGKTTAALCIAHELYGDKIKGKFLELNASDERGIDVIRERVKEFARQTTVDTLGLFRIVYLDEADALTKDAQHALRRMMETYAHLCRFILACNYSSKIIAPIQSRCAVFRFSQLNAEEISAYLKKIARSEGVDADEGAYKTIIYVSEGDMRKAINILQTSSILKGKVTEQSVFAATGSADPVAVKKMLNAALEGNFREARRLLLALMLEQGMAGEDIIKEIHNQIYELNVEDKKKIDLLEKAGEYEFRLTEGSNARIQLEALLAQFGKRD